MASSEGRIQTRRLAADGGGTFVEHQCWSCYRWFFPSRRDQRYCTPRCRLRAWRARRRVVEGERETRCATL